MRVFSSRNWGRAAWALVLFKLWLYAAMGIFAIGGAGHDDRLFLHLTHHLMSGDWLGPYNELTLAKGSFYSMWMAANFYLGVPLSMAQQIVYVVACWILVRAVQPLHRRDVVSFVLFTLLLWNPMSYEGISLSRIFRQNISTPLALVVVAGAISLYTRNRGKFPSLIPAAMLLGFGFGTFWLTREEGIWLVPTVVLLVGCALVLAWKQGRDSLRAVLSAVGLAVVCGTLPVLTVCSLNLRYYGWFGTVEFRAPEFIRAYSALTRVTPVGDPLPFVHVKKETRLRIYAISPSFAELRPFLEGETGENWAGASTFLTKIPQSEREIAGGWLMWALRDAASRAGHAHSAREALDFYDRIASEINTACDRGLIAGGPPRHSMIPPWRPEFTEKLFPTFVQFADYFASYHEFRVHPLNSVGYPELLAIFRDLTRDDLTPSPEAPELVLPHQRELDKTKLNTLRGIGKVLRRILFALSILAVVVWVSRGAIIIIRRRPTYLWFVAASALGGCLALLLINVLVHITSFPAMNVGYLSPGYPLSIFFSVIALLEASLAFGAKNQCEQNSREKNNRTDTPTASSTASLLAPVPPTIPPPASLFSLFTHAISFPRKPVCNFHAQ